MEKDLKSDWNKIVNEQPPFGHVVYFNSRILLKRACVKVAFEKNETGNTEGYYDPAVVYAGRGGDAIPLESE